ncbi:MAG: YcxB family protein [Christensenella sp.]|uniref:YcxB family protein n=1 Tax=Christensenella sp. TaxID=1935934 RepID=UPI002B21F313|nr:YcxB family protein [Christensenella sp.]MEA5004265.1 YcxB family protein [Christensenella sp.]
MQEIKFTTTTDFQIFKDYWMFSLFEKKGPNGKMNAFAKFVTVLCVLIGIALVLLICNYTLLDNAMGVVPVILLGAVVAAFVSCYITVTRTQPKRQYKAVQQAVENPQKYTFTQDKMEVREYDAEEDRETLAEFSYDDLVYGYETPTAFYLFINDINAFLIPQKQLEGITPGEFAAFLREKLGERYLKSKKCS